MSVAHVWDLWRSMDLAVDQPSEQQRLQIAMAAARVEASEAATVSFEQLCQLMHPTTLQPEVICPHLPLSKHCRGGLRVGEGCVSEWRVVSGMAERS